MCILVTLAALDRSCRGAAALAKAKADYAEMKKVAEANHEIQQGIIAAAQGKIDEQAQVIGAAKAAVAVKDAKIAALSHTVAELQAQEPVQPELEKEPLVINLRAQVSRLGEMFTLSEAKSADKDRAIISLKTIIAAKDEQFDARTRQYENERALRIAAEEMFKMSERRRGASRMATKVALGVAGAAIIYGLSKSI